ncbi:MAG: hypothetical protein ACR2HO_07470 [Rubrobacteraceae bacterium]
MGRSLVAGLGLVAMLATLLIVGYLSVKSLGRSLMGDPSSGPEASLVIRISGSPGVAFSGNYTTATGSQNINGTVGAAPMDFKIPSSSVAGVNVVTVNVQRQGTSGALKVELVENGQVVQSQEANAATGTLSLTYSP